MRVTVKETVIVRGNKAALEKLSHVKALLHKWALVASVVLADLDPEHYKEGPDGHSHLCLETTQDHGFMQPHCIRIHDQREGKHGDWIRVARSEVYAQRFNESPLDARYKVHLMTAKGFAGKLWYQARQKGLKAGYQRFWALFELYLLTDI